jgi:hypothetical protein
MDASARRVRAERDQRRLPPRPTAYRWVRRILGMLATAAFLGVGVAIAQMVVPDGDGDDSALDAAPAATPAKQAAKPRHKVHKHHKARGLTKAQRRARAAAVAEVRLQGYTALRLHDYDPRATLRVLIARPVGDAGGGSYAFFFLKDHYLGRDSVTPSSDLRVAKHNTTVTTLSYGVCCPATHARVRFRLEGAGVHPLDSIPLASARLQRR